MKRQTLRRTISRVAAIGVSTSLFVAMAASPAAADTSNAKANALTVSGVVNLTTGLCTAANPPAPPNTSGPCTTGSTGNNLSSLVAASVLTQSATASAAAVSAACAGLSGPGGGAITVGASGQCVAPANPAAGGVVLLGGLVTANAVYATCSAAPPTPANPSGLTGSSTTLSLNPTSASGGVLSLGGLLATLGTLGTVTNPATGQITVTLTPVLGGAVVNLLTLDLNKVDTTTTPGVIKVTALDLNVLTGLTNLPAVGTLLATLGITAGSAAEVRIGFVTCGPNAVTTPVPVFPLKGAPIAIAIAMVAGFVGWRLWWIPRQRRSQDVIA